jgi:hypothetical protein
MDYHDTTLTTKPQQAQVLNSGQHRNNSRINKDTMHNKDTTDNGNMECSVHDPNLSTYSGNSDIDDCGFAYDSGGDKLNDKHTAILSQDHNVLTSSSDHIPNAATDCLSGLNVEAVSQCTGPLA